MEVSTFFTRLLQPPKEPVRTSQPDSLEDFDTAWQSIRETLEHPDERQLVRGISSTEVPVKIRHIVDALVYESNRADEDTTGACLEYFLKNEILASLERLCEADRPHGIKAEVLRAINNLVVLLSERFLIHNAVHRPLRRLLRSCIGDEPDDKSDTGARARVVGAAGMSVTGAMEKERRQSNEDIEGDLVDLMCVLCSKMRAYPPLLLIFFHDKGWLQSQSPPSRVMSPTPSAPVTSTKASKIHHQFEFLLFSYLLRFVHREGRLGDFARAGLIFLFDIAFLTPQEEGGENLSMGTMGDEDPLQEARDAMSEFILDGDFADVIAAALGAVYSLLPTKLHVPSLAAIQAPEEEGKVASGGMYLGSLSLAEDELEIAISTDNHVRVQLDLMLKLLAFLQDIIQRCHSPLLHTDPASSSVTATHVLGSAIADAILDAVQASFLDNVLYPSVLECAPDDGSGVAVITYLDAILGHLDDGPVLDRVLAFLMNTESSSVPISASKTPKKEKRRTGAIGFVGQVPSSADYFAAEGRFTLKDLISDSLQSDNWEASTAALKLLRTLLSEHGDQATRGLLSYVRDPTVTVVARKPLSSDLYMPEGECLLPAPVNFTDIHLQEIELYGSLLPRLDFSQTSVELSPGFSGYLADVQTAISSSLSLSSALSLAPFMDTNEKTALALSSRHTAWKDGPIPHRLSPSDPLVKGILDKFEGFLARSPDENVALTGVVLALGISGYRSIGGWIIYDKSQEGETVDVWAKVGKSKRSDSSESDSETDADSEPNFDQPSQKREDPFSRSTHDLPALYQLLRQNIRKVAHLRTVVPDFDRLLGERRQGLLFRDHLDEAMSVMLDVGESDGENVFGTPPATAQRPSMKRRGRTSGLADSLKSLLTPKRKPPGGTPGSATSRTPESGPASSGGLGLGLGLGLGFSTPTRGLSFLSPSPSPAPVTPVAAEEQGQASAFKSHYDQTHQLVSLSLGGDGEEGITSGPWSPQASSANQAGLSAFGPITPGNDSIKHKADFSFSSQDEIDLLSLSSPSPLISKHPPHHPRPTTAPKVNGEVKVPLSRLLDNCIIMEEFLKEIVALIVARRGMGVDQVGYV